MLYLNSQLNKDKDMRQIPMRNEIGSNDHDIAISAVDKALLKIDSRVVGILRDDKKKTKTLSKDECLMIQDLLAEAYWILDG